MLLIIIAIVIFVLLIFYCIEIVSENTVYVIETFGKFSRIMPAGLNFRVPVLEQVVEKISLKQQTFSFTGRYHTVNKEALDVTANIIFSVTPTAEAITNFVYTLEDRDKTISATIENALRTSIARETHDDVLQKKEALTQEVKKDLQTQFTQWGIEVLNFQILAVKFILNV